MVLLLCSDVVRLGSEGILSIRTKVPDLGLGLSASVMGIAHPLPNSMVRALPRDLLSQTGLEALLILPQSSGDVVHGRAHCQSEFVVVGGFMGCPCPLQLIPAGSNRPTAGHCWAHQPSWRHLWENVFQERAKSLRCSMRSERKKW